ncbi:MAG: hypothetical protein R6X02_19415 [Enhygromyxa sp.]
MPEVDAGDMTLVRHRKRKDWGIAALLWERDGKRGYQFSDGNLRVFKQGFYHMFESAEPPGDGSATAVRRLARLARAEGSSEATRLPTLRDQISMFRREFPEGFASDAWHRSHRGAEGRKRLKRHRDPAIDDARWLGAEQLAPLIESFSWSEIHARLVRVLSATNLIPAAQLKKLEALPPSRELACALSDWVSGDDNEAEPERRFNLLVRALGSAAKWPVVTAIAGLLDPEHHVCVRPSVFEVQAKMLLPNFRASKRPSYAAYRQYLHVAQTVSDELTAAGLRPGDFLDVHDFIAETLRPSAREQLLRQDQLPSTAEQAA